MFDGHNHKRPSPIPLLLRHADSRMRRLRSFAQILLLLLDTGIAWPAGVPVTNHVNTSPLNASLSAFVNPAHDGGTPLQPAVTHVSVNAAPALSADATPSKAEAAVPPRHTLDDTAVPGTVTPGGIIGAGISTPPVQMLSQNALISIYGQNFLPPGVTGRRVQVSEFVNGNLPPVLLGVCVDIGGQRAAMLDVFPTQINAQVPAVTGTSVSVRVLTNCGTPTETASEPQAMAVRAASPEFFYFQLNADGNNPVVLVNAATGALVGPSNVLGGVLTPARAGDILTAYATGFGPMDTPIQTGQLSPILSNAIGPVSVSIGGVALSQSDILYAGVAPGEIIDQLNFRIPSGLAGGNQPLVITVGGISSPPNAFVAIQQTSGSSPPVIAEVNLSPDSTSETISWTTDVPATSRVDYGTSISYGSTVSDSTLLRSHSLKISQLTCDTTYDVKITSGNSAGNTSAPNATFHTSACSGAGGPISDNFDSPALNNTLWSFVNPAGDGTLNLNGSGVVLQVPQGARHDAGPAGNGTVRLMQPVSNVDFEVEVRFQSSVMFRTQRQGIIVEQDPDNFLRFDVSNDGTTSRLTAYSFIAGSTGMLVDIPINSSGPPFWLRIHRSGNLWTESYSLDGTRYTAATAFNLVLTAAKIGPFVGNSGDTPPAMAAEIDYFFSTAAKTPNLDGPLTFVRTVIDSDPPPTTLEKVLADIDGDGRLDAVIGFGNPPDQASGAGLAWYEYPHSGNPFGVWQKHTILDDANMYEDAKALDVNGDGAVDIIASFDDGTIYWLENPRGHGGNPATETWPRHFIGAGSGENNMAIADIDADGKLDLVTNAFVFFQNNTDSWTPVALDRTSNGVALLDIGSGRGAVNLVGMGNSPFPFVWLENPREHGGNARTDPWVTHVIGPGYDNDGAFTTYASGDMNGDGRMDVITAISEGALSTQTPLYWWEAPVDRRNGKWIPHVVDPTYTWTHNVRTVDMDGNGALDIVAAEQEQSQFRRVAVFYNDGRGNFTQQILSSGSGHSQVTGDTSGRGVSDILSAGHGYTGALHPIELYLNTHAPVP